MNYYEHHLGDYLRNTAHLSMLEDGAYRRLIDAYYIREKPLPSELREVYRLVRATSKQEREAVDVVLREFFEPTLDGWLHARCERELDRYREGEVGREAARENAKERQRRTRERRRGLFEALRSHNIVPPYDTSTSELQRMLSRAMSQPVTRDVTCDATATQTPDTNTPSLRSGVGRATRLPPNWEPDGETWNWAVAELGSGERMGRELAKFRDYWVAKSGRDGTKLDWNATWRNWVRRAVDDAKGKRHSGTGTAKPLSAVERVRQACGLDDDGFPLGQDDGDLRPQVDEQLRREADGCVVDAPFRVVSG